MPNNWTDPFRGFFNFGNSGGSGLGYSLTQPQQFAPGSNLIDSSGNFVATYHDNNWVRPDGKGFANLRDYVGGTIQNNEGKTLFNIGENVGGSGGFLSGLGNGINAFSTVAQGLSGLVNAYTSLKALQQAQDQFKFQKGLANRNLANQAKIINNTYDTAAGVAAGLVGSHDASGAPAATSQTVVNSYMNDAKKRHVDGSAI